MSSYIISGIDGMVHANNPVDQHKGGSHCRADQVGNLGCIPQPPLVPQAGLLFLPAKGLFVKNGKY